MPPEGKDAKAEYMREWRLKNKERINAQRRERYLLNQEREKEYSRKYREDNIDRCKELCKAYKEANKEKVSAYNKEYKEANKEKLAADKREWERKNKKRIAKYRRGYKKTRRPYYTALQAKRRARMAAVSHMITPEYKAEMEEMYRFCMENTGYEVDHIVPLNGEKVCGLHVPWNMQILTKAENIAKSNKFEVE